MIFAADFVSIMGHYRNNPEDLPSIRLVAGGRGVLSKWNIPMRKVQRWHIYRNLTPGGQLIFPDRTVDMATDLIYLIPGFTPFAVAMSTPRMEHCYVDFEIIGSDYENIEKKLYEFGYAEFDNQLKACFGNGFSALACCSLICSLLQKIIPHSYRNKLSNVTDPRIRRVLKVISDSLLMRQFDHLTNADLCKCAGTSMDNFRHLFQKETGFSPHQYILSLKLETARKLLFSTNISIEEVAIISGLGNRCQLTKHFTAVFQQSPSQFRKSTQENTFLIKE